MGLDSYSVGERHGAGTGHAPALTVETIQMPPTPRKVDRNPTLPLFPWPRPPTSKQLRAPPGDATMRPDDLSQTYTTGIATYEKVKRRDCLCGRSNPPAPRRPGLGRETRALATFSGAFWLFDGVAPRGERRDPPAHLFAACRRSRLHTLDARIRLDRRDGEVEPRHLQPCEPARPSPLRLHVPRPGRRSPSSTATIFSPPIRVGSSVEEQPRRATTVLRAARQVTGPLPAWSGRGRRRPGPRGREAASMATRPSWPSCRRKKHTNGTKI